MNSEITIKKNIENTLKHFDNQPLRAAATTLLNTLGYYSKRVGNDDIDNERFDRLFESALDTANPSQKLRIEEWQSFYQIMQVADEEINQQIDPEQGSLFESTQIDDALRTSYMFVAVQLTKNTYTRTQLADITRFINKAFEKSIMVMFRYGAVLSLAIINRRPNLRSTTKQVLEKVTLIKDINLDSPKRAHIDIISELHLHRLIENESVRNFDTLHKAWEGILNTEPLNRKFYTELYKWYQWAIAECEFPDQENDMQVIRMITRLLFIWFLKEKGLVPENIFKTENAEALLNNFSIETSDYYQAVLQNLFFATLNTPIKERTFSTRDPRNHRDASKYRYNDLLQDPSGFLEHLKQVPFVNGGLFDCLDTFEATGDGGLRIDCFTDNENDRQNLNVPAKLFFHENDGIFPLFSHYKFTIEENTPVEQEVALDPELLGQVFENLLGAYNPETRSTARKATGSYYTPRQIVDYMVDEALIAYFLQKVEPYDNDKKDLEDRLRDDLLAYNQQGEIEKPDDHLIHQDEIRPIIAAIDELKIIDPAVGTGAFPMGILNKLVLILRKLDPQNERWKQRQLAHAEKIEDPTSKESAQKAIEQVFSEGNRYNDYGRKLYLIQNCIYGVDIQPIATTIAKLRFFISLVIEQESNDDQSTNYGIRPLPNLETKFVAANTLIGLNELNEAEFQLFLENEDIRQLRQEIAELRRKHFGVNTRQTKLGYMKREKECREQLAEALAAKHARWCKQQENRIEQMVADMPSGRAQQQLRERLEREYTINEAKLAAGLAEANRIAHWDAYDQNAVAEFFDPEWMFGVEDGFDIAIGNPPYIRHEKIRHLKPALQAYFDTFFTSTADISVYFYKRAAELLRDGGLLTYICTNKFMRNGYGKNLRRFLKTDLSLRILLDFGSVSVFDAGVNACIVLVEKCVSSANHVVYAATLRGRSDNFYVPKAFQTQAFPMRVSQLSSDGWTLASPAVHSLLEKLYTIGTPLSESIQNQFYFGIKTGYDSAFIIDTSTRERLISTSAASGELIKPLLRGRTLKKWKVESTDAYLIVIESTVNRQWPWSDMENESDAEQIFVETYPAIHQHLAQYREHLITRDDQGKFYWELRSCAYYAAFDSVKIIYPGTAKFFYGCYDMEKTYGLASTWILPTDDFSLLAILNSRLFDWYARHKFQSLDDPWTGGRLNFKKVDMENVPIADRTQGQKAEFSRLIGQVLANPESHEVRALEKEIDALVYRLYRLSADEIALIEQTYRDAGMDV